MAWRRAGLMLCAALAGGVTALAPLEQVMQAGYSQLEEAGAWLEAAGAEEAGAEEAGAELAWLLEEPPLVAPGLLLMSVPGP